MLKDDGAALNGDWNVEGRLAGVREHLEALKCNGKALKDNGEALKSTLFSKK